MTRIEHILTTTGEECTETAQELLRLSKDISKALRFGLDDKVTVDPYGPAGTEGPTNREKMIAEFNDVLGMTRVLVASGVLPENWQDEAAQERKARKFESFLTYAASKGTLQ